MADEFARPEETLSSRAEREENRRFAESLRSASTALNAEASQAKLLLPKLILRRKAVESEIASKQRELANDRINLQLVQDKISSAKFEQSERTKLQAKLAEELANKQQLLASSQGELAYRQDLNQVLTNELQQKRANLEVQQQTLSLSKIELAQKQATLEARQQELKAAQDNLTAKTAGRDVTQSELDRVMTLYAEQVNADILAGKGASDAQKALAQRKFELTSALEMYQQEIQTAQRSVETLPGTIAGLERSLAVQAIEVEALTENVTGAQSEIVQLVNRLEDNNRELIRLPSEIQGLTSEVKQLESEIKNNDTALAKLPVEIQGLTFTAQRLSDNMEQKERDIRNLKLKSLSDTLTQVGQALIQLREKIYSLQQELGTTFGTAISVGAGALVNRVTSFFSGGPILSFQETIDTVNAFQKEFGGILTRGEAQKIAQASKSLGVSADVFLKAQRNFLVVGGNVTKNTFIGQFRAAGLTAANALQFAAQNANLVAIAGTKYANELARAAANAQRIGVGLDKTEALADGIVGDFEGALERFSELRAMGVEVDFNKLAAVAGTGTPQEVLSELQGQLGGNQKLLEELQRNRFLKVALERDLGLNVADITKLAAGEEAKAPEQTQEEKDRTVRDKILERVGTVVAAIGGLVGIIGTLGTLTVSNTLATNANTIALGGQKSGLREAMSGLGNRILGRTPTTTPPIAGSAGVQTASTVPTTGITQKSPIPTPPKTTTITTPPVQQSALSVPQISAASQAELKTQIRSRLSETSRLAADVMKQQRAVGGEAAVSGPSALAQVKAQGYTTTAPTSPVIAQSQPGFMQGAMGGMKGGALAGAATGVFAGVGVGMNEYAQSKSIGRAIMKGIIALIGAIIGGMIVSALLGGLAATGVGAVVIPFLTPVLVPLGASIGATVATKLGSMVMGSGKAAGGLITGPGTPTSDNILTPTSPGEYVVSAKATKAYGTEMLDRINKGAFTPAQTPAVNNVVNVNMDKMEAKLDRLAAAFSNIKIEMDGNTVGRVAANSRSSMDRLSVVG